MYMHVHARTHVRAHTLTRTHAHTHTHAHTNTHTHTHTHIEGGRESRLRAGLKGLGWKKEKAHVVRAFTCKIDIHMYTCTKE